MSTANILIVDDDEQIRKLLGDFFSQHGLVPHLAENGQVMQSILNKETIDLVILDIMMPGEDGLSLCRTLRKTSNIPIIMLTAIGEEVDRIVGLEMGADDYIAKPFSPRELLARVKAILRRTSNSEHDAQNTPLKRIYQFSNWQLDPDARQLLSPDGLEVNLSTGEFSLLVVFLERPQKILSRDQLLDLTKNRLASPFDRSIDIQISRIRHKIEENHKQPQIIKTVRGGGYMIAVTVTTHTTPLEANQPYALA